MATWTDIKLSELVAEFKSHKGQGESKRFYELRDEITKKLGKQEWERLYRKAKVKSVDQEAIRAQWTGSRK